MTVITDFLSINGFNMHDHYVDETLMNEAFANWLDANNLPDTFPPSEWEATPEFRSGDYPLLWSE